MLRKFREWLRSTTETCNSESYQGPRKRLLPACEATLKQIFAQPLQCLSQQRRVFFCRLLEISHYRLYAGVNSAFTFTCLLIIYNPIKPLHNPILPSQQQSLTLACCARLCSTRRIGLSIESSQILTNARKICNITYYGRDYLCQGVRRFTTSVEMVVSQNRGTPI